jgi:copper(I)-binding protein
MIRLLRAAFAATILLVTPAFAHNGVTHLGPINISLPFTRATLPNAPVAGGFLTIENTGTESDRLISATSDIAGETQIHEMAMEGDVMKMRPLADGLEIPAGETVVLAPGGYHIMFMGLKQTLVEGEKVAVTLTFEKAGTVEILLPVEGAAADAPTTMEHTH